VTPTTTPLRLVVTGSECTGKTTLARALAGAFGATWVREHARSYAATKGAPLEASDVEAIARGQLRVEDDARGEAGRLLVLDTDLLSTVVYAEHYYGGCPGWIRDTARARRGDLYLLCHPDVPWIADGIRDQPAARREIHQRFAELLAEVGARVVEIRGPWPERSRLALDAVEHRLAASAGLVAPSPGGGIAAPASAPQPDPQPGREPDGPPGALASVPGAG
jgi:NadR type nicotinamide-nucleotide adenylyltransferase